ncbi:MAG: hypothetical protein FJW30_02360 [Acidobacteria bacterium]|nr:hypothetical protein [Acidobacteriota bacterium]
MEITPTQRTAGEFSHVKDSRSAATEFEAVLIGHLLQSAFAESGLGLGDTDSGSKTMLDFGREHLSRVISQGGGLGLAKIVETGLKR